MSQIIVGIGEYAVSNKPGDILKTIALGSCVAVICISLKRKAAGILHLSLPDHNINEDLYKSRPGSFADTGIPLLFNEMRKLGCLIPNDLIIKLAGGANVLNQDYNFDIGKKNLLATRKILWEHKLGAIGEDVGGSISRNVTIDVETGKVVISNSLLGKWEI